VREGFARMREALLSEHSRGGSKETKEEANFTWHGMPWLRRDGTGDGYGRMK
jgi:hypothetical protein